MSDTITIDGVTLTTEEAREVLAFWDHESTHVPWCLTVHKRCHADPTEYPRTLRLGDTPLDAEIIEQLRDHCFPWVHDAVERVTYGSRIRRDSREGALTQSFPKILMMTDDGTLVRIPDKSIVEVRRPREAGTRLRDVEPGTLVERVVDGARGRRLGWDYIHGGGGVILEGSWRLADWPGDTLVRIVEGES